MANGPQLRCLTTDVSGSVKVWSISSNATAGDGKCSILSSFECKNTLGSILDFGTFPSKLGHCVWPDIYIAGTGREVQQFSSRRVKKKHLTMTSTIHSYSSNSIITVENKSVRVWDIMTGKENENMTIEDASTHEITCITTDQPLQRKIYTGNTAGAISTFNSFSGSTLSTTSDAHKGAVAAILYCKLSKHVISTGLDKCIKVFSEEEGALKVLRMLVEAHSTPILMASYNHQFSIIATAANEEIKLWDFQDLQLQDLLDLHATEVTALEFVTHTPLFMTGDIQGRIFIWRITPRGPISSATCSCLTSLTLPNDELLHNVRHFSLYYGTADVEMSEPPVFLIASDFSGMIAFWSLEEVIEAIKSSSGETISKLKPSEYSSADENYNPTLRYEKNGIFSAAKRNISTFPAATVVSSRFWQAHDESILSLSCIIGSPMIVTTAADCKLRLWAAIPTKVGIRECRPGDLFGEIDSMDYQEQRFERLEHWHCPSVQNLEQREEHDMIAEKNLKDLANRDAAMVESQAKLSQIPASLLMLQSEGAGLPLLGGAPQALRRNSVIVVGGVGVRRRSSGYSEFEKAKYKNAQPLSEKDRHIRSCLRDIKSTKAAQNSKRMSMRASMTLGGDSGHNNILDLMSEDKSRMLEMAREKQNQIRKVMEAMRQHLTSAHQSKTRSGKVIYGHLYGELKQKSRDAGLVFTDTDTSMSDFVAGKFEEEEERIRLKEKEAEEMEAARLRSEPPKMPAERGSPEVMVVHDGGERDDAEEEKGEGRNADGDGDGDDDGEGEVGEDQQKSFFVTTRPETPQFEVTLDEKFDTSSSASNGGEPSLAETESAADTLTRISDLLSEVDHKMTTEDSLQDLKNRKNPPRGDGKASPMKKRISLVRRQSQLARKTDSKISDERRLTLEGMKQRTIAKATHFGTYTRTEVIQLAELLHAMDLDGDGEIKASEFEHYIKKGKYGDTFKHLQFEVMDKDKSGEISHDEIVSLVFHKAHKADQKRIGIAIKEEIKRRTDIAYKKKTHKPKLRRISAVEMSSARQIFSYFDVGEEGSVLISDFVSVLRSDDQVRSILEGGDIRGMLRGYCKQGAERVDLDDFVRFTYEFNGPYEVFDYRQGKVVETRN